MAGGLANHHKRLNRQGQSKTPFLVAAPLYYNGVSQDPRL